MKSGIILIVVGLVMFLTALWGGTWLSTVVFPFGSTFCFPAIASSVGFGFGGMVLVSVGATKMENSKL